MWLPTPLYEALPYSAVVIGSACILGAINVLMVASGVLLVVCGGVIWKLRRDYRAVSWLVEIQRSKPPVRRRRSRRGAQPELEVDGL